MRDVKTGQILPDPKKVRSQRTIETYDKKYPYYYALVYTPISGMPYIDEYRGVDSEQEARADLREILFKRNRKSGYVLKVSPKGLSFAEVKKKSIGLLLRVKNDGYYLGYVLPIYGHVYDHVYVYHKRRSNGKGSKAYYVTIEGSKIPIYCDYDPYE